MSLKLVQPRVHLRIIQLFTPLSNTLEQQGFGINLGVHPEDIEHDPGCRPIITGPDDIPITDDEDELPLVIVLQHGEGVDRLLQRFLALGVAWYLADDELVEKLGLALRSELERSKDYEREVNIGPL